MPTLVIGGAGFIGQEVVRQLVARGERTIVFDLTSAPLESKEPVTVVSGDATRFDDLSQAITQHKIDRIIHLAFLLGEGEQMPHRAVRINVVATDNVFEATRLLGVKRTVYASSISYHGHSQDPFGDRPVSEDDIGYPAGVYTASKQFNEALAARYRALYGCDLVALRLPFVIGPTKHRGILDVVNLMTRPALGEAVQSPLREDARFIVAHLGDIAGMFVTLALSDTIRHAVYHAGGHAVTAGDIAAMVRETIPDARITFDPDGKSGFLVYRVDNSRITAEFTCRHRPLRQLVADILAETRHNG